MSYGYIFSKKSIALKKRTKHISPVIKSIIVIMVKFI